MTDKKTASVSDGRQAGGVSNETPAGGEGVAKATPSQPSGDGEARFAEFQRMLDKAQKDLNSLKSASQRREEELRREILQQREKYERQLTALMDDETRTEYENSTRESRLRELQEQAQSAQAQLQRQQATTEAFRAFTQRGVPPDVLADAMLEGPEAMAGVAWDWLFNRATPSQQVQSSSQEQLAEEPPEAPNVVTTTTEAPYEGPSWDDLVQKYGSEDQVFTLVESGLLPTDVVPEYRNAKKASQ